MKTEATSRNQLAAFTRPSQPSPVLVAILASCEMNNIEAAPPPAFRCNSDRVQRSDPPASVTRTHGQTIGTTELVRFVRLSGELDARNLRFSLWRQIRCIERRRIGRSAASEPRGVGARFSQMFGGVILSPVKRSVKLTFTQHPGAQLEYARCSHWGADG
jgi:hypothetical protein